jgi:quercetin dioxygenase-like cupin family protein
MDFQTSRKEVICRGNGPSAEGFPRGVVVRWFASKQCGSRGLATASFELKSKAALPDHLHDCGESITIVEGEVTIDVAGRVYELQRLDCVFVPAGVRHSIQNNSRDGVRVHAAFASADPSWTLVTTMPGASTNGVAGRVVEAVRRFPESPGYELAPNTDFHDLFAKRLGSAGICGGYGLFQPGAGLPCHLHSYDESITIIAGEAICEVEGQRYPVSGMDTALVPKGRAHRFFNKSNEPMAMIWVYAGDEPERTILDVSRCSGGNS